MSRMLVDLLGLREQEFRKFIDRLERVCLNPSVDIRLSAEIVTKTREKIAGLGLDGADTTSKELFHALKHRLIVDDESLRTALKLTGKTPEKIIKTIADSATKLSRNERALCLSQVGAKRVLSAVQPRKTLKALHLRSLDSVLKRADARLVYALATQLEDESWKSQVHAKIRRLPAKDIGWRTVEAVTLPSAWYEKCHEKLAVRTLHLSSPDVGVVMLLPVSTMNKPGAATIAFGFVLQALQRLSIESLPYRRHGFVYGYHNALPEIILSQQPKLLSVHGIKPSWHLVHELLSKGHIEQGLPEMEFELQDLSWQSTEMKLASVSSAFDFWVDTHYLGVKSNEGKPISFHILDVAVWVIRGFEYGHQTAGHFEGSLWNELCLRYLQQDVLSKALQKQLQPSRESVLL